MEVAAQDSGVETECDQESNDDSSLSSVSVNNGPPVSAEEGGPSNVLMNGEVPCSSSSAPSASDTAPSDAAPKSSSATPEPATPMEVPPSIPEAVPEECDQESNDGYLGDCSSDGGTEKNFPMPTDRGGCKCHSAASDSDPTEFVDPPAGLAFQNIPDFPCGYQILLSSNGGGEFGVPTSRYPHTRKMRSIMKNKFSNHGAGTSWAHMKVGLAERKLRIGANLNNSEIVERMIGTGVNINASDEHSRTALHFAAAKGYSKIVQILLQNGADPNCKDILGNTALHLAACTNHIEVVTHLIRSGANVTSLDHNGRTPMQLAQSKLKLLQKSSTGADEMTKVKAEVAQVLEMMREYLNKTGHGLTYNDLIDSFSQRFTLHQTPHDINSDLQNLLDSLGNLSLQTKNETLAQQ